VLGPAVLLQALEGLAVASGLHQRIAALGKDELVPAKVVTAGLMGALSALEVSLTRQQVRCSDRGGHRAQLALPRLGDALRRGCNLVLAALMLRHGTGQCLLGGIFMALTQGANTFQSKAEGGTRHARVFGRGVHGFSTTGQLFDGLAAPSEASPFHSGEQSGSELKGGDRHWRPRRRAHRDLPERLHRPRGGGVEDIPGQGDLLRESLGEGQKLGVCIDHRAPVLDGLS
jgi:hypothetical protein